MRFTIILIVFVFKISSIFSQNVISIEGDDNLLQIGDKCSMRPAIQNSLYVEDVMGDIGFQKNTTKYILLGGRHPDKVWIKLTIHNKTKENIFLESLYPQLDTASLYAVENGFLNLLQQTGQHLPFSTRSLDINNPALTIKPSDKPVVYILAVKVKWACNLKLRLGTYKSIIREDHHNDILTGIFIGVILVYILYNMFIYFQLKDSIYLLYSAYLASASAFSLRHYGFFFEFITRFVPQYNDFTMILQAVAGLLGIFFTVKFLNIRQSLPKLNSFINLLYLFFTANILFSLVGLWEVSIYMAYVAAPVSAVTVAVMAFKLWRKGSVSYRYCFIGWVCLTVGMSIFILENAGILPYNNFTNYALYLGIGLEATFLSFAIAHRFSLINDVNQDTQAQMIKTLEENKRLVEEKNKMLEDIMHDHGSALEFALSRVNESEIKLQDYARQLEKSNRELTEFAHIASHDLKAPIRGIMSFAQLFERRNKAKFDDTDREYFNYIKSNASQSARLIEDLLNYSKIDKNLGNPNEVDLNNSVFLASMNLQNVIQEKGAEIIYENLPTIIGHASLMTHLFQNLIGNGIKYNKSLRPIIEISVAKSDNDDVIYAVKDNGIGIAPQHQQSVFAMFRRLHGQSEYEGTGIGLSFCTRIVETYSGRIWVESEEGKGTIFYFTLPKATIVELKMEKTDSVLA